MRSKARVERRPWKPGVINIEQRARGVVAMESYRGVSFEPSLARIGLLRMWPKWAGRSRLIGGTIRWQDQVVPSDVVERSDWMMLKPILSGICGSDIAVIYGKSSAYLAPLASFPAVLGHEIVARVLTSRPGLVTGSRVVVDPTLGCAARGETDLCPACRANLPQFCANRQNPAQGPGMLLGYHHRWPGGFSTTMWAPQAQCWPVPETMPDERAVLTEPLATVLAGLEQVESGPQMDVLVIGAGTIGLLATWMCRQLWSPTRLHVSTRYSYQATWARVLGADATSIDEDFYDQNRAVVGRPSRPGQFGAPNYYPGGYDLIVDAVGTAASIRQGLAQTKPGGQFLQLGGVGQVHADLTGLWSRGIRWIGSYGYHNRGGTSTFPSALAWLHGADVPIEGLVTHHYPIDQYARALQILRDRGTPTIKVVLSQPNESSR